MPVLLLCQILTRILLLFCAAGGAFLPDHHGFVPCFLDGYLYLLRFCRMLDGFRACLDQNILGMPAAFFAIQSMCFIMRVLISSNIFSTAIANVSVFRFVHRLFLCPGFFYDTRFRSGFCRMVYHFGHIYPGMYMGRFLCRFLGFRRLIAASGRGRGRAAASRSR